MRWALVAGLVLLLAGCVPIGRRSDPAAGGGTPTTRAGGATTAAPAPGSLVPSSGVLLGRATGGSDAEQPPIAYPESGTGRWQIAPGSGQPAGGGGPLLRYRVAVEDGIGGVDVQGFADTVSEFLSDPRGWTGDGKRRLQLAGGGRYEFTIYLATPATRDKLCGSGWDRYTSCRNGNAVVLNVARWVHGVPNYGATLDIYRRYMVNHETGHLLGYGHQLCPGPGKPAPVMEQQTLGLHGCTANPWHLVGGRPYAGPNGAYDDPIPTGG